MKQFLYFFLFCMVLLIQSNTVSAQSRFTYQIKSDIIINGLFDSDPDEERNSTKLNLVIPGPSFAVGGKYGYFLNKKRNLKISISHMLEYKYFTRFVSRKYDSGSSRRTKKRFQSINLSVPLSFEFINKKWTLGVGVVAAISLRTRVKYSYCSFNADEKCNYSESYSITHFIGNEFEAGAFSFEDVYTAKRFDFQYLLAIQREINQNFSIGLAFKNYIFDNHLFYRYFDYDVTVGQQFKRQTNALHVSLFYKI